jgi:hypothetical protein
VIRPAALLAAALVAGGCADDSSEEPIRRHLVYTKAVGLPAKAVWIGDVDGRKMRRLTRGDYGLVAPDGRIVAISTGSETHTIGVDGRDEEVVSRGRPAAWFSDSRHLLVFRGDALVSVDVEDGDATDLVPDANLLRGWSVSPDGNRLVYGLARKESRLGQCGEYIDIYAVDRDGGSRRRITDDGRSSDPVWGDGRIAFAREPVKPPCVMPKSGIWTIGADGNDARPILRQAPRRFAWNGYYGLRPHGWVSGRPLLVAGVRTEWGDELALVDLRSKRIRRPDLDPRPVYRRHMYVDHVSRDGRYVLATGCGAEFPCTISIFSVLERRARHLVTGRVGNAHWNH